tara:strand:- start:157 stop:1620 length:1464 start_codon:yes stop_codon:yes gene_type:complete
LKAKSNNSNDNTNLLPVILSGGTGTRLWPLSRFSLPKQYLSLEDKNQYTMLQNTYLRLNNLNDLLDPLIICNEEHRFIVAEQMREIDIKPKSILLEPFGRNTCPAILLAALMTEKENIDPILLVLSADHKISNKVNFSSSIKEGLKYANNGRIVIFGVKPTHVETNYGYIESCDELSENKTFSKVKKFIEKPNLSSAKQFLLDKHFTWNSGIFMFKASTIIKEVQRLDSEMLRVCKKALIEGEKDLNFQRLNKKIFANCPNSPIDISVMEKTDLGTVIRMDCGWNDLGNWQSIWKDSLKDSNQNTCIGKVFLKKSKDSYFRSESRLLVGIGLDNLLAIETDDAILIANKNSSHSIKDLVKDLEKENFSQAKTNSKVYRPWGNYKTISEGKTWKVKKIEILAKASLSLQLHKHRAEHWVIVNGIAKVEIDNEKKILYKNQSVYVPLGAKHRLSNPSDNLLTIIEVQSGEYLEEDDIIRFDDMYGRKTV